MIMDCLKYVLVLVTMSVSTSMYSQDVNAGKFVVALAELSRTEETQKRHNSLFFTFKIKEVISGEVMQGEVLSQELFMGYGGADVLAKIYKNYRYNGDDTTDKADVIIKFSYRGEKSEKITLRWVAEKNRLRSLTALEKLLSSFDRDYLTANLLEEDSGRFFFTTKEGIRMVAVENYMGSGIWLLATMTDNK
jgi:hypothetical protein